MATSEFHAEVQQTADDPRVSIAILAPEEIRALPRPEAEERLSTLLHQLRVRPEFTIYGFGTFASYVDPIPREQLFGHNTLVEVNLPYTLHLPTHQSISRSGVRKLPVRRRCKCERFGLTSPPDQTTWKPTLTINRSTTDRQDLSHRLFHKLRRSVPGRILPEQMSKFTRILTGFFAIPKSGCSSIHFILGLMGPMGRKPCRVLARLPSPRRRTLPRKLSITCSTCTGV